MKNLQGCIIRSVGTARNYEQALTRVAEFARDERIPGGLRGLSVTQSLDYLQRRGAEVGQKTLDMERQAIQCFFQHVTHQLEPGQRLPVMRSQHDQVLCSRAYTPTQVRLVVAAQTKRNALSTQLAHAAGLRAHELFTLLPLSERPADERPALPQKFLGRSGHGYTVIGKGGLTREVLLPETLVTQLEALRRAEPRRITDRRVHYLQFYDLNGGNRWSSSFTTAAQRTLGWSAGAHGVRHSYAQERMGELQQLGLNRALALEVVSQEMGHFRPEITETYLR